MAVDVTVDIVIFTIRDERLKVLLILRKNKPFQNLWALPGGFVREESLETAALRELHEETGVKDVYLEQLYTFGDPNRDPRGRIITVAYFALVDSKKIMLKGATDASQADWFVCEELPELAFDHKEILDYALKRLRWKLEYTTVAFSLLPEKFTLSDLQKVYEIVFNKKFDKRNFRKKILGMDIVKPIREKQEDVKHRPAELYMLNKKIGEFVDILK